MAGCIASAEERQSKWVALLHTSSADDGFSSVPVNSVLSFQQHKSAHGTLVEKCVRTASRMPDRSTVLKAFGMSSGVIDVLCARWPRNPCEVPHADLRRLEHAPDRVADDQTRLSPSDGAKCLRSRWSEGCCSAS